MIHQLLLMVTPTSFSVITNGHRRPRGDSEWSNAASLEAKTFKLKSPAPYPPCGEGASDLQLIYFIIDPVTRCQAAELRRFITAEQITALTQPTVDRPVLGQRYGEILASIIRII